MPAEDLKKLLRGRLLDEMLGAVKDQGAADWSVLILDAVTTRVMSYACRISEILDYGISLVENVNKKREPLPALSGIYFLSPSDTSVLKLIDDFKVRPLYKTAHVFFSSKVTAPQITAIKSCPGLTQRLKSFREVNLEVLVIDRRTFVTDEERSLQYLFGEDGDNDELCRKEVAAIATRLSTVFLSLKEMPTVRFRVARSPTGEPTGLEAASLVAQRVALETHSRLADAQRQSQLPQSDTCDLIVIDRGYDVVAPVIQEWTYEAMIYDLLNINHNMYSYDMETRGGKVEKREHMLGEGDDMWMDLRHKLVPLVFKRLSDITQDFYKKGGLMNQGSDRDGDVRNFSKVVQKLPQYQDQLAKLGVHNSICHELARAMDDNNLMELGKLEQDLVFGDATSKEVIAFLTKNQNLPSEHKLRLLMCYVATHPEKLDEAKAKNWQRLAKLSDEDMAVVTNLEFLGVPVRKRGAKTGALSFGRRRKRTVRKDREQEEDDSDFQLSRFVPMMVEVLEELVGNRLSTDEYPYVAPPTSGTASGFGADSGSATKVGSVRTNRSTVGWAKKGGAAAAEAAAPKAKRVVVFVVGGITRSEMRAAARQSAKLGREVLLGGTSVETPASFVKALKGLSSMEQVSLDIDSFRIY